MGLFEWQAGDTDKDVVEKLFDIASDMSEAMYEFKSINADYYNDAITELKGEYDKLKETDK